MKTLFLLGLLAPAALVAGPPKHVVPPEMWAESWVKAALKVARTQGMESLVKEVGNPDGRFRPVRPGTDPVLTVFSETGEPVVRNRPGLPGRGEEGAPKPSELLKLATPSGPVWTEYQARGKDGVPQSFRAFLAVHENHLIMAVLPK